MNSETLNAIRYASPTLPVIRRAHIYAPSTHDSFHIYSGEEVIIFNVGGDMSFVYVLKGNFSMQVPNRFIAQH